MCVSPPKDEEELSLCTESRRETSRSTPLLCISLHSSDVSAFVVVFSVGEGYLMMTSRAPGFINALVGLHIDSFKV